MKMFSWDNIENPWILVILLGTFAWIFIGYSFQRKFGKKEYRYDERYHQETNRAKGKAWDFMLVLMLIAMPVVVIVEGATFSYFLLMTLYTLHMLSMGLSAVYYRVKRR
jgi:hypothetical protein